MGVKLTAETMMTIDHDDLCAVLTDYLCQSSYGAFSEMQVTIIREDAANHGFSIVLNPKPKDEAQ